MHDQLPEVTSKSALPIPCLNVVLFQPEIPQNTGNIGRTCVALNAKLWIVRPAGFRLDDKLLQRAGLDYWQHLSWEAVDSWDVMLGKMNIDRVWYFTKFATKTYTEVTYRVGDWLVFGSESRGLPDSIRATYASSCLSLPMTGPVRSLNLSVAVGVGMFEAHRQLTLQVGTTSSVAD
jgi:tRNA (cytidine/uridine-2'-O-)-methyltransferase